MRNKLTTVLLLTIISFSMLPSCKKEKGNPAPEPTTEELLLGQWYFSSTNFPEEWLPCDQMDNLVFKASGEIRRTYYRGDGSGGCTVGHQVTYPYRVENKNKIITTVETKEGSDTSFNYTVMEITDKVLVLQSLFQDDPEDVIISVYIKK